MIDKKTLQKIATLARLEIKDSDFEKMSEQLSQIMDYAETLNELDLAGIEPTAHAVEVQNVFRTDDVVVSDVVGKVLAQAPEADENFFRVPKVL